MARLSAVITCFSVTEDLKDMALDCATRVRDQVDELIISDDSDQYWPELHKIADIYLVHPRMGFKRNMNLGWKLATGDFIAQINSDAMFIDGDLRDLCLVDAVGIPIIIELSHEMHTSQAAGVFLVTHRNLTQVHGGWDNVDLDEYDWGLYEKWRKAGYERSVVRTVRVSHPRAGATSHLQMGHYKGRPGTIALWPR